jgi:hypothetical protein
MKDMTSVANTMLSEEEKAEAAAEAANTNDGSGGGSASTSAEPHLAAPSTAVPATGGIGTTRAPSSDTPRPASLYAMPTTSPPPSTAATNATSAPSTPVSVSPHSKKRSKLTPEQREKLMAHEKERKRALEARVRMLTDKLVERLRPFVEAKNPGAPGDAETEAWEARMRREADDLKLESFGVELLHAIGTVYVTKASSFLKSKRFLGM